MGPGTDRPDIALKGPRASLARQESEDPVSHWYAARVVRMTPVLLLEQLAVPGQILEASHPESVQELLAGPILQG
jgi:hypothetical protein